MAINPENRPHTHQHKIHHNQTTKKDTIDNLKSLNSLLVKETIERRQQVESLIQSKNCLQSELHSRMMDNETLKSEMNLVVENAARLEIEKGVVFDFIDQVAEERIESGRLVREKEVEVRVLERRLGEVLSEIDEVRDVSVRVGEERDAIRARLDEKVGEESGLKENEARVMQEVAELKGEYDRLVVERIDVESRFECVMKEKDDVEKDLVELKGVVDELKRKVVELTEEKKVVEDEKMVQDGENVELEAKVVEFKKMVESLRDEEGKLVEKFADLEKKYAASLENEVEMKMEIDKLVGEKKEMEARIGDLVKVKSWVSEDLEAAMKELEVQKVSYEQVVEEKTELENVKMQKESEIGKMNEQISTFKDTISSLETRGASQSEKVKELEDEAGSYKSLFDQAALERDEVMKQLNDETAMTDEFNETVIEMKEEIEDLNEKLATLRAENGKHVGEKKQLEEQCAELVKEVAILEAKYAERQMEFDVKLGAAEANSNRVLNILKKTVLVCDGSSDFDQENGVEDGIKEHVAGIEAIKIAFKDKESRLAETKKQLELVKSSAAEARKEKSFWTMVSSATTILAAVASLAYVARAH